MTHRPGDNNTDDGDDSVRFLSPGPGMGQIRAGGWEGGGGEERDGQRRGGRGRMEEGRKETIEEGGGEGQVGGKGQREQGSLTGGHSGQGDT